MRKQQTLREMRVTECAASLMEMSNSDMFRLIQNHFNTHNTLPGNKNLKDTVWAAIQEFGNKFPEDVDPYLAEHSRGEQPYTKDQIIGEFASARIQQTNITGIKDLMEKHAFDPESFAMELIGTDGDTKVPGEVNVYKMNGTLQKVSESGNVWVIGTYKDGNPIPMGKLPDNFLTNNPMYVDGCKAEIQIADFSNGKMKNLSFDVVVDTDLMSGDVLDMEQDFDAEKGFADAVAELSTFREDMVEQGMA